MSNILMNTSELLTAEEVSQMLKISRSKLSLMRMEHYKEKADFIPFVKFGSGRKACVRYKQSDIKAYIEKMSVTA